MTERVVAVTGASGFCGSAVARLADAAGLTVRCLGRRPGPVGHHIPWDATRRLPDLGDAEAVIHLAAAVGDPGGSRSATERYRAVNVAGTARLLAAAAGRTVVWVSSASVYAPGPYAGPVTESHPTGGQRSAYGRTKAEGERLALAAGAVVLRPRAVHGPGDPHLLPRLRRVARGGRIWLPGADVPMSLTAVGTLAHACLAAAGLPAGRPWEPGAYNIADEQTPMRDEAVSTALGDLPVRHLPVAPVRALAAVLERLPRPRLTRYGVDQLTDGMVLDTAKARAQGWQPPG